MNESVQSKRLALPVGRAQHSLKLPTLPEASILEATAVKKDGEVQTVAWGMIQEFHKVILKLLLPDSSSREGGWSSGFGGLPGQQPDGQVDEVPAAVGVCQGVLVGEVVHYS